MNIFPKALALSPSRLSAKMVVLLRFDIWYTVLMCIFYILYLFICLFIYICHIYICSCFPYIYIYIIIISIYIILYNIIHVVILLSNVFNTSGFHSSSHGPPRKPSAPGRSLPRPPSHTTRHSAKRSSASTQNWIRDKLFLLYIHNHLQSFIIVYNHL